MARRKLLLVTYHFPPSAASGAFRMLGFARHLPKFGWDPVVVAPPLVPFEPIDEELARRVPPEVAVYRVPFPSGRVMRLARRLLPHGLWMPGALAACARAVREHQPAALLTSSPPYPVHLLGGLLKLRYRLPWVIDFRDPWVATMPGFASHSLNGRWEALAERWVMNAADAVVSNAPRACAALQEAFPAHADKILTVTNGYDPEVFPPQSDPIGDGPLTVLHAGEVYGRRDPRPLLDALRGLRGRPASDRPVQVRFVGQIYSCDVPAEASRRGLDAAVMVEPQVGYAEALARMSGAGILLLLDSAGRKIGVPAKLYEYLGAGRPILALAEPDGDTAWALRTSGAVYRIAPPGDPARIEQALRELVPLAAAGRSAAPARDGPAPFTRERLARELAGILDAALSSAPAVRRAGACRLAAGY
jgi:glycosyltransferase involved in cell wall biosynthesis